jgi:hypothetical protein
VIEERAERGRRRRRSVVGEACSKCVGDKGRGVSTKEKKEKKREKRKKETQGTENKRNVRAVERRWRIEERQTDMQKDRETTTGEQDEG